MKKALISLCVLSALAAVSGCNSMLTADSPWAPREQKKSATQRWEEREQQQSAQKSAETQKSAEAETAQKTAPETAVPAETREVAEIVFTEDAKKFVVAYRLGGIRPKLQKGDKLAVRAKDMTLRGAARLDVIDGDTLGFSLVAGTAVVGDLLAIPDEALGKEMAEKFLPKDVPADENAPEPAAP